MNETKYTLSEVEGEYNIVLEENLEHIQELFNVEIIAWLLYKIHRLKRYIKGDDKKNKQGLRS